MTASTSSSAPAARHAKTHGHRRAYIIGAAAALAAVVGILALVLPSGGPGSPHRDPLAVAIAGIARSPQMKLLTQDAQLARNCNVPVAKLPKHGTIAMVWPGRLTAGLVGSEAIESYAPTRVHHRVYDTYTWTLNPLQTVTAGYYAVRTAPGKCSTALPMKAVKGPPFSLGNGKFKPMILLVARVPRGTTLVWVKIVAVDRPIKKGGSAVA